jgi:Cadherin-like
LADVARFQDSILPVVKQGKAEREVAMHDRRMVVIILSVSLALFSLPTAHPAHAATITTVDSTGGRTSIAILNGLPVISYYDFTNGDLRVASDSTTPIVTRNHSLRVAPGSSGNVISFSRLFATDPDDGPANLTYSVITAPAHGTLNLGTTFTQAQVNAGSLTYSNTSPGDDSFTYTVTDGFWTTAPSTFTIQVGHFDTIGVFRPSIQYFMLRNSNTSGPADIYAQYGTSSDLPIVGDWNGDGVDTIGFYRSSTGEFVLRDSNSSGPSDHYLVLGIQGDTPIAGDWDNNGTDGVGVFRPSNGLIYLRNSLTSGFADFTMVLGSPGDVGLAGDWNYDGTDSPGVYRPNLPMFFLSNRICNCGVVADYTVTLGVVGDVPVVGDWNGDGTTGTGVFRPTNGLTYLRNDPTTSGVADIQMVYGVPNDKPVAGHWIAGSNIARQATGVPTPPLAPTFQPKR